MTEDAAQNGYTSSLRQNPAEQSWSRRLGAIGKQWCLSVVRLNLRFWRALSPFSRISRAVRRRPTCSPLSCDSQVMRGLP